MASPSLGIAKVDLVYTRLQSTNVLHDRALVQDGAGVCGGDNA
jgi:hypothetical protein